MLDHSEFQLSEINRALQGSHRATLANARDEDRIKVAFADERPQIVFHPAALKQVDLLDNNPSEGALVNVMGNGNALSAAMISKADEFVIISPDRAPDPSNDIGATNKVAEPLLDVYPASYTLLRQFASSTSQVRPGPWCLIFQDQIARDCPTNLAFGGSQSPTSTSRRDGFF